MLKTREVIPIQKSYQIDELEWNKPESRKKIIEWMWNDFTGIIQPPLRIINVYQTTRKIPGPYPFNMECILLAECINQGDISETGLNRFRDSFTRLKEIYPEKLFNQVMVMDNN